MKRRPTILSSLRRLLSLRRRTLAALAAFVAVLATVSALQPPAPETVPVVAAAADLPGGTRLTPADVLVAQAPPSLLPDAAARSPDEIIGRVLNGPVTRGSLLTSASVATGRQLVQPGYVVAPLPLADEAIAPLVEPGSRIDLLALDAADARALATDVRVVGVPEPRSGGVLGGADDRTALVEVTPTVALELARASQVGGVMVALRS